MALEHADTLPALLPIPELDCHIIGSREDKRLGWVNSDGANVVGVGLAVYGQRMYMVASQAWGIPFPSKAWRTYKLVIFSLVL